MKRSHGTLGVMLIFGVLVGGGALADDCENVNLNCDGEEVDPDCNRCTVDVLALRCAIQEAADGDVICLTGTRYEFSNTSDAYAALPKPTVNLTLRGIGKGEDIATLTRNASAGTHFRLLNHNAAPSLTLDNVKVTGFKNKDGSPEYLGGAIYVAENNSLIVKNSTLKDNDAKYGGAIYSDGGSVRIENSTLAENKATYNGGAVATKGPIGIERSTLNGNSATSGGAALMFGSMTIRSSTLIDNEANYGSIIYGYGQNSNMFIHNSTLVKDDNQPSAIFMPEISSPTRIGSSILKGADFCEGEGHFQSRGNNLMQDTECGYNEDEDDYRCDGSCGIASELRYNGGPTQTLALLPDSKALGKSRRCSVDQRGVNPGPGRCDIGAYQTLCSTTEYANETFEINLYMDFENPIPNGAYTVMNSKTCTDEIPHGTKNIEWYVVPFNGFVPPEDTGLQAFNIYFHKTCHQSFATSEASCGAPPEAGGQPRGCQQYHYCIKPRVFNNESENENTEHHPAGPIDFADDIPKALLYRIINLNDADDYDADSTLTASCVSPRDGLDPCHQEEAGELTTVRAGDSWWYTIQWSQNVNRGSWDPVMRCKIE